MAQFAAAQMLTPPDRIVTFNSAGLSEASLLEIGERKLKSVSKQSDVIHVRTNGDFASLVGGHLEGSVYNVPLRPGSSLFERVASDAFDIIDPDRGVISQRHSMPNLSRNISEIARQ